MAKKYGKKSNSRDTKKFKDSDYDGRKMGKNNTDNDITWYAANEQLLRDAANFSFATQVGSPINYIRNKVGPTPETEPTINFTLDRELPGIMSINVIPGPGHSINMSSPVNMCARNVYSFVRKANSGAKNYDAADLMMYLLAMDNLYSFHAFITRAYGIATTYSAINRYFPAAALRSMSLDWEDIQNNLANFRYWINTFAVKIGTMAVPNTFYYYQRHAWMFSNIYADAPTAKCQAYIFNPEHFFVYEGFTSQTGGRLIPVPMRKKLWKVKDLVELGNRMIRFVVDDPDFNIMSGDILKAFDGNVLSVSQVDENYTTPVVMNAEVLTQIHNATAVGNVFETDPTDTMNANSQIIYVNNNVDGAPIIYNPKFIADGRAWWATERILDLPFDDPKPGDNMIATRLMAMPDTSLTATDPQSDYRPSAFGSELVTTIDIYTDPFVNTKYNLQYGNYQGIFVQYPDGTQPSRTTSVQVDGQREMAAISKFGSHPPFIFESDIYLYADSTLIEDTWRDIPLPYGDMDNVAVVQYDALYKLHQTAMLSLFNVPSMGAWARKAK